MPLHERDPGVGVRHVHVGRALGEDGIVVVVLVIFLVRVPPQHELGYGSRIPLARGLVLARFLDFFGARHRVFVVVAENK